MFLPSEYNAMIFSYVKNHLYEHNVYAHLQERTEQNRKPNGRKDDSVEQGDFILSEIFKL